MKENEKKRKNTILRGKQCIATAMSRAMLSAPIEDKGFVFTPDLTPEQLEERFYKILALAKANRK